MYSVETINLNFITLLPNNFLKAFQIFEKNLFQQKPMKGIFKV